ncbi:MAG: hypothetical protein Q7S86_02040 [bacterium]|nr:hypothetical protein [bacterium]
MKKALLFIETTAEVAPEGAVELDQLIRRVIAHTVIVETPSMTGSGVILADGIITSLFLVGAYTMVTVVFSGGESVKAVVIKRDEENHIAKLRPIALGKAVSRSSDFFSERVRELSMPKLSRPHAIGDPLLVVKNTFAITKVRVGAILYTTKLSDRKVKDPQTTWQINPMVPRRLIGSGVWDIDGGFVGLALGKKLPIPQHLQRAARKVALKMIDESESLTDKASRYRPRVYTVPAEVLLNFAETA